MTKLVTMLYKGDIIQGEAQEAMMDILYKQQLNQRLPRFLPRTSASRTRPGRLRASSTTAVS